MNLVSLDVIFKSNRDRSKREGEYSTHAMKLKLILWNFRGLKYLGNTGVVQISSIKFEKGDGLEVHLLNLVEPVEAIIPIPLEYKCWFPWNEIIDLSNIKEFILQRVISGHVSIALFCGQWEQSFHILMEYFCLFWDTILHYILSTQSSQKKHKRLESKRMVELHSCLENRALTKEETFKQSNLFIGNEGCLMN
ncbi:hypothetical protein H5410_056733 [Solanum commersonii]|uniref:Uncharacterized protein n=1 Tax=Solanum commersonii TaxID=4109 RepID=A0A9J5WN32_SOLCO|nr:hypothetical protein H5410_056733 [Solanum commersonii]